MFDKRMPCANLEGLGTHPLKTLSKITGDRPRITLPRSTFECSRIYVLQGVLKEILIINS